MPVIRVKDLSKEYLVADKQPGLIGTFRHFFSREYTSIKAVESIGFNIDRGEIVGFIGPNGAGKTTTLKMLCGLIHPTSGVVNVSGNIPSLRKYKFLKDITLVMGQKQQLIWDLPPIDSLKVNAAVYGIPDKEASYRIQELALMLDLKEELNRPVRKLSLGQRMKAELLASLLHRPSILFLDEPTLGLDVNSQLRVRDFLYNYNQKYQATIILTSHYMADITSLCKRILVIDKGQLFYDGPLAKLTQQFSPSRLVRLEFNEQINFSLLKHYGKIIKQDNYSVKLLINRNDLPQKINNLLNNFSIRDLEIADPPIEEIISKIYSNKIE